MWNAKSALGAVRNHYGLYTAVGVLSAIVIASISAAVWAVGATESARTAAQNTIHERDRSQNTIADLNAQLRRTAAELRAAQTERDRALAARRNTEQSLEIQKAVLAFLRDDVLSAGKPKNWTGPPNTNVTLREAV